MGSWGSVDCVVIVVFGSMPSPTRIARNAVLTADYFVVSNNHICRVVDIEHLAFPPFSIPTVFNENVVYDGIGTMVDIE